MAKPKKFHPEDLSPDYEVGFGKPPKETQFKKGQSGNPRGRPKGSKNSATVAHAVLNEKITIHENGRQKVITKREALVKQLVNRSLQGDLGFLRLVVTHILPAVDAVMAEGGRDGEADIDDALILGPLLAQLGGPVTFTLEPGKESPRDGAAPADGHAPKEPL